MSTAPVPKPILKPPVRNPWVSEDCGESSSSDGGGAPGTTAAHGPPHQHQYATPYPQTSSGSSSHGGGGTHPNHTSSSSNSQPCSVAGTHQPTTARGPVPVHGPPHHHHHHHAHQHHPPHHMAHHHGGPPHSNVPHSQTMQSLPEVGNAHGQQMPLTTAHSLHGTLPPPPPPWAAAEHQMPPPWVGNAGGKPLPPGLFTVGQDPHWQPIHYTGQHQQPMLHYPLLTQGHVSSHPMRATELSRCEQCHAHCFRAAQAAFVGGIVTGFSLLVAGGVFHRQHGQHLQVLVYIGALVSLVCVVLLVIFCAMNKDFRGGRRGGGPHGAAMRLAALDPEAVPLRQVEVPPVIMQQADAKHTQNSCIVKGGNPNMCHVPNNSGPCIMVPNSHNVYLHSSSNHTHATGCLLANQGANMMATEHQHFAQARHVNQRSYDEEAHRYNQLWKQQEASSAPTTTATTSHQTHHSSSSTTHKTNSEAVTNF
ncbi:unnamed protein product [Meganyctiphanes norvegica]|uniref:Uncharacterized protein n=1 Tax=Meganyctiphanes norvegica TaxID=48144 RepID=A0AAV2PNL9_MEGNR